MNSSDYYDENEVEDEESSLKSNYLDMIEVLQSGRQGMIEQDIRDQMLEYIHDLRMNFYPSALDPKIASDAVAEHFESVVIPRVSDEIRELFMELYSASTISHIRTQSKSRVMAELRSELEAPIRKEIWDTKEAVKERIRSEMMDEIKKELKQEMEAEVRNTLRMEIIEKLGFGKGM